VAASNASSHTTERVREYYRKNQILYTLFWTERRALSMNVGLWTPGTRSRVHALENQNALIGDLLRPTSDDRILEAGCGTGGTSIWLSHRCGARGVGITLCERQAAMARRYAVERGVGARVSFVATDFTQSAFPDGAFSAVFASESVCHADNKAQFVEESFRLLQPGGRLVVLDAFLPTADLTTADRKLLGDWCAGWAVPHLATVASFDATLKGSGFESVAYRDLTPAIFPSARRLYAWGVLGGTVVWGLRLLGLASRSQQGHALACRRVYPLAKRGICHFGAFSARKPEEPPTRI
jgi:cyclopropane fatty-acyl-phospholipid synthase-like methyltransferase